MCGLFLTWIVGVRCESVIERLTIDVLGVRRQVPPH
jgi:hypothetical protein